MKAYKCDRCDKYFDELVITPKDEVGIFMTQGTIKKDLCKSCLKSLQKWWRNVMEAEHEST